MKQENWTELSRKEQIRLAQELLKSPRGEFILGQALAIAAIVLESRNEDSNREDMEMLGEALYGEGFNFERNRLAS